MNYEWFINNEKVELVDACIYLGVKFVKNCDLKCAAKTLMTKL